MGRGHKTCKHCSATTGPRSLACPKCGKAFTFKNDAKVVQDKNFEWTQLVKGDLIKVVSGSGPTYKGAVEVIAMGYRGIFRVSELDKNGIHAYPVKAHEAGHCFIVMKPITSACGLVIKPHRVRKLKTKKQPHKV